MTDAVNTYWAKFKVDSTEFQGGISQATTSFLSFYSQVTIAAEMTMQIIGRITAAIGDMAKEIDKIQDLSIQLGITTEEVQRLQWAALYTSTEFSAVEMALNKLVISLGEAQVATSKQAQALRDLHINTDGKSTADIFNEVVLALGDMENTTARNRIAYDLFGKSYKEVIAMTKDYDEALKKANESAIINDKTSAQIEKADIALKAFTKTVWDFGVMTAGTLVDAKFWQTLIGSGGDPFELVKYFADPGEVAAAKESTKVVYDYIDAYAGLTDEEIDLKDAQEALNAAIGEQARIMRDGGTDSEYEAASRTVALYTNRVKTLTAAQDAASASAAKTGAAVKSAWSNTAVVGTAGTEMYDYLMREMETGTDYDTALQKWASGASHFQAGSLGAAKESGAAASSKVKKTKDENKGIEEATTAHAIAMEKIVLTSETAMAEMARVKYQKVLDMGAEAVNWMGSHPIVQKQAVLSKSGYDIDISPLPTVVAPKLAAADFGSIKMTGGAAGGGTGGNTTNNNVVINVTTKDNPQAVGKATSQALANSQALGGAA